MRLNRNILSIIFLFCITACANGNKDVGQPIYIPPTSAATLAPVSLLTNTPIPPSPTPICINDLTFLSDITIPDGTIVTPGQYLDKQWLVENSGTCNWNIDFQLHLITGPNLGVPEVQKLFPARSGGQFTLRLEFTAPSESGTYRSAWQAYDPGGSPFGDPIYIEVIVP